jgi:hypothetical protein
MGKYHEAVQALDRFTKLFCNDNSVKYDLVFRCKECGFELPDGTCLIKAFKCKYEPDYKDFGSMGDL